MNIDEAYEKALERLKPEYGSTIQTGDILIKEGERDPHVHFIISGLIEVYLGNEANKDALWTLSAGQIIGEMSLLDNLPRTASARALEPCDIISLDSETFYHLITHYPALSLKVIQLMGNRMRKMDAQYKIRTGYRKKSD